MEPLHDPESRFTFLSELLLAPPSTRMAEAVRGLTRGGLESLRTLAATNHVIIRAFARLREILEAQGQRDAADLAALAIHEENVRIHRALQFLHEICRTLERCRCPVTVIKSLDHWPDLGSDLDLYTDAEAGEVVELMGVHLKAKVADRSWGDRLANKWNFKVPGLPELVEVHVGRLGQTGEQTAVTKSLSRRTNTVTVGNHRFRVPAPEERIIISTLQRMYRHFYIRLCDVVDNARLLDSQAVDFAYLHHLGLTAGLWEGIATYLAIISGYVERFRGEGVPLTLLVRSSARFGSDKVRFRRDFLRVPILPHSLNLYAGELKTLLQRGQLRDSLRLTLLPGLATAAALEQKITGSDKGIW